MTDQDIVEKLQKMAHSLNMDELESVCEEIKAHAEGVKFLPNILAVLENNANVDFGSPGAIVHTVERYFRKGYELQLMESIQRAPTCHTVWMLNRVVNGVSGEEREQYVQMMKKIADNQNVDINVREAAKEFLNT